MEAKLVEIMEHHLPYEIGMLVFTSRLLETMQPGNLPDHEKAMRNALIESFCIHARNLIDFLEGKKKKSRLRAKSVTDGYKPASGWIDKALTKKIEDQIAHITINRTLDPSARINGEVRTKLLRAIAKELVAFRKKLRPQYRHTPWRIEVDDEQLLLQKWFRGNRNE
jgi:hypothetical protein